MDRFPHVNLQPSKIPTIPAVQGRRKFLSITTEFQAPNKSITDGTSLELFLHSEAFMRILDFCQTLADSVRNKKLSDPCHVSPIIVKICELLDYLNKIIDDIKPETENQRFGNVSFRKWLQRVNEESIELLSQLGLTSAQLVELQPYFIVSFGDGTRLDYGSGHELSFTAWLCCLDLIGFVNEQDYQALITRVFAKYLDLVRKLQVVYNLEPAGSHGVWGLDDFQFLAYFWGSAQLLDHPKIKPKSITDKELTEYFAKDYIYLACINFINKHKRGPFHEHSPILYDISGLPHWTKVHIGLLKMYIAEVLSKFPIMQHFLFGSLLPLEPALAINPS